jgi:hypothetical protein
MLKSRRAKFTLLTAVIVIAGALISWDMSRTRTNLLNQRLRADIDGPPVQSAGLTKNLKDGGFEIIGKSFHAPPSPNPNNYFATVEVHSLYGVTVGTDEPFDIDLMQGATVLAELSPPTTIEIQAGATVTIGLVLQPYSDITSFAQIPKGTTYTFNDGY